MTWEFWVGIVAGAFAGYYLPIWGKLAVSGLARRDALRVIRTKPDVSINSWIIDYYVSRGNESSLFHGSLAAPDGRLPFLVSPGPTAPRLLNTRASREQLLTLSATPSPTTKIDKRRIARRRRAGKRVYDAPILQLDDIIQAPVTTVRASSGRYLQCVSTWFALEEETIRCARTGKDRTAFRDANYANYYSATHSDVPKMVGIGVPVVVFDPHQPPQVLLQRSSRETASAITGNHGVIPALSASPSLVSAERSLVEMNILREVAEELFGMDELERGVGDERLDPAWFLRLVPLSQVVADLDGGQIRMRYLSSGFECINGTYEIHVALEVDAGSGTGLALKDAAGNWEVARDLDAKSLMFTPLHSPEIDAWYRDGRFSIGSAVAITQLRRIHSELVDSWDFQAGG